MSKYTINTECAISTIEAADVEAAKEIYAARHHFDFADVAEIPGSYYQIADENGDTIEESCIENMPH